MMDMPDNGAVMAEQDSEKARRKRQNMRSLAIAVSLGILAILFYLATIIHLGGNVANRAL